MNAAQDLRRKRPSVPSSSREPLQKSFGQNLRSHNSVSVQRIIVKRTPVALKSSTNKPLVSSPVKKPLSDESLKTLSPVVNRNSTIRQLKRSHTQISHSRGRLNRNTQVSNSSRSELIPCSTIARNIQSNAQTIPRHSMPQRSVTNSNSDKDQNIKELFRKLFQRLDRMEEKINENNEMLCQLTKKKHNATKGIPSFLPFRTVEDLERFDKADNSSFNELVDYFIYLGGKNAVDCAALYFKSSFDASEEISPNVSWLGKTKPNKLKALSETSFADACEEAMKLNIHLTEQNRIEFIDGMTKALKSMKERKRRNNKNFMRDPLESQQEEEAEQEFESAEHRVVLKNVYREQRQRQRQPRRNIQRLIQDADTRSINEEDQMHTEIEEREEWNVEEVFENDLADDVSSNNEDSKRLDAYQDDVDNASDNEYKEMNDDYNRND